MSSDEISLYTQTEVEITNIFSLVMIISKEPKSLIDIFNEYDGTILAYDNNKLINIDKEQLEGLDNKFYCVTCYNSYEYT